MGCYPTKVIGPPTSGERVLGELLKESLGGWWRCTAAGTPGTWQQVLPAAVAADPSVGTVTTGCLVLSVTTGTVKCHAGGYVWETQIGGSASARVGFWGATPVAQPSGAVQAAVTLQNLGAIGGLTISDPPTQVEVQALRDKCEELADDVRALSALAHALRGALVAGGGGQGWGVALNEKVVDPPEWTFDMERGRTLGGFDAAQSLLRSKLRCKFACEESVNQPRRQ
jgi:hypothetical protein